MADVSENTAGGVTESEKGFALDYIASFNDAAANDEEFEQPSPKGVRLDASLPTLIEEQGGALSQEAAAAIYGGNSDGFYLDDDNLIYQEISFEDYLSPQDLETVRAAGYNDQFTFVADTQAIPMMFAVGVYGDDENLLHGVLSPTFEGGSSQVVDRDYSDAPEGVDLVNLNADLLVAGVFQDVLSEKIEAYTEYKHSSQSRLSQDPMAGTFTALAEQAQNGVTLSEESLDLMDDFLEGEAFSLFQEQFFELAGEIGSKEYDIVEEYGENSQEYYNFFIDACQSQINLLESQGDIANVITAEMLEYNMVDDSFEETAIEWLQERISDAKKKHNEALNPTNDEPAQTTAQGYTQASP